MSDRLRAAGANLAVVDVAAAVLTAFRAASIEPLLLKGPPLGSTLYGEDSARGSGDVDFLIREADAASAAHTLAKIGFSRATWSVNRPGTHAEVWSRPPSSVTVDLHRTLVGVAAPANDLFSCLAETSAATRVGTEQVRVPAGAGLALLLALHAAAHGCDVDKPLDDLRRGLEVLPDSDWFEARRLALRLGAVGAFEVGLSLVGAAALSTSSPAVDVTLRASSAPHTALGFERLAQMQRVGGRLRYFFRTAFPPRDVLFGWHSVARRGRLGLTAAYVMRLAWLARWAGPGFLAWRRARRDVRQSRV